MRYIKEVLGVLGVLPLVVIHGLPLKVIPKWSFDEYEINQANKRGEGSSKERKKFKDTKREKVSNTFRELQVVYYSYRI